MLLDVRTMSLQEHCSGVQTACLAAIARAARGWHADTVFTWQEDTLCQDTLDEKRIAEASSHCSLTVVMNLEMDTLLSTSCLGQKPSKHQVTLTWDDVGRSHHLA